MNLDPPERRCYRASMVRGAVRAAWGLAFGGLVAPAAWAESPASGTVAAAPQPGAGGRGHGEFPSAAPPPASPSDHVEVVSPGQALASAQLILSFPADIQDAVVFVNGDPIPRGGAHRVLRVPAGLVTVEVAAAGRKPWRVALSLQPGALTGVSVAPLEFDRAVVLPAAAPSAGAPAAGFPYQTASFVALGTGAVALATGLGLWYQIRLEEDDLLACDGGRCSTEESRERFTDLRQRASLANLVFGVGAAGILGGGLLSWLAPEPVAEGLRAQALPSGGGWVSYAGTF